MKYQAIHKNYEFIKEHELLNILLKQRGVEDPKKLLNVDKSMCNDEQLFLNMDRGLNMLHWHIENNSNFHILYDVDSDGINSAATMHKYILRVNPNATISYSMNDKKQHGIILENLKQFDFNILIVPDAGSNDISQCKILTEQYDKDILILDHHKIEKANPFAVVINCQDGVYPNPTLSGSGVVYKFLQAYDKKYGFNYADENLDLVAIGIIGDSMDLRNYETRFIALEGIKTIKNNFVDEIIKKNKISDYNEINFDFINWKVVPYLNAVTRVGTQEEKNDLIKAILGVEETREYQPRRKHKEDPKPDIETQSLQQAMVRGCTNIKSRQDRLVEANMKKLIEKIETNNLLNNKIIIVDGSDELEKSFTGLVANKLASIYKRPVIILKKSYDTKTDVIYGGSYRNYELFPVLSLMNLLNEIGTFDMIGGHDNAGGFKLKGSLIKETQERLNEKLKDVNIEDIYFVDYEIPVGRLQEKHIMQVGQWANIWGNTLKQPMFAITDININVEDIQIIGDKRNLIKFQKVIGKNTFTFIKKFAGEDVYNKMILKNNKGLSKRKTTKLRMEVVGYFTINKWNDQEFPQIEIIDFNVFEGKEFRF